MHLKPLGLKSMPDGLCKVITLLFRCSASMSRQPRKGARFISATNVHYWSTTKTPRLRHFRKLFQSHLSFPCGNVPAHHPCHINTFTSNSPRASNSSRELGGCELSLH